MPYDFSTENLSIHFKILIGLKDQFDLHKLLSFFLWKEDLYISIDIFW